MAELLRISLADIYCTLWMLGFAGWYDNQPYHGTVFYFSMPFPTFIFDWASFYFLYAKFAGHRSDSVKKHFSFQTLHILFAYAVHFRGR
jgi:hypothetical protein